MATAPGKESRTREAKGMFVVAAHCPQFMRTILVLPRDKKIPTRSIHQFRTSVVQFCRDAQDPPLCITDVVSCCP